MLKKKLRGKSKFLRKMNELMEIYSRNQDTAFAYGKIPRSGKCASPHSVHQSDV